MMTVDRKELSEALERVKMFVSASNPISVLAMIRINKNQIIGTDRRKSVIVPTGDFGFDVCVDFKKFQTLIKKTKYETVEISLKGKALKIVSPEYEAELATESSDKFPDVGDPNGLDFKELASDFRSGVAMCSGFASTDEVKYYMTGVHVEGRDIVATDGKRMAVYTLQEEAPPMPSITIPNDVVTAYMGMDVDFYAYDEKRGKAWFQGPDGMFVASMIEGEYPNYKRILENNEKLESEFDLEREALAGSDIVRVFTDGDEDQQVLVRITDGVFAVLKEGDRGKILFKHEIEEYDGPDAAFSINYGYFVNAVQSENMHFQVFKNRKIRVSAGPYTAIVALIKPNVEVECSSPKRSW